MKNFFLTKSKRYDWVSFHTDMHDFLYENVFVSDVLVQCL